MLQHKPPVVFNTAISCGNHGGENWTAHGLSSLQLDYCGQPGSDEALLLRINNKDNNLIIVRFLQIVINLLIPLRRPASSLLSSRSVVTSSAHVLTTQPPHYLSDVCYSGNCTLHVDFPALLSPVSPANTKVQLEVVD